MTNNLAYYVTVIITTVKGFIAQAPGWEKIAKKILEKVFGCVETKKKIFLDF